MAKALSTIHIDGKVYKKGDEVDIPENELQSVIDAGAVEGKKTNDFEVGSANNPSRLGAGVLNPQVTEETLDAQIATLEAQKKALQDSKSEKSNESGEKPYEQMNKRELLAAGEAKGVALDETMTNREMVDALNSA